MAGPQPGRLRHAEHEMGTVVSFDVPAWAGRGRSDPDGPGDPGTPGFTGALGGAVRWLHWVDATFSPYRDESDVSRLGRGSLARPAVRPSWPRCSPPAPTSAR